MGSGPVPSKRRSGGLSASTTFKIAAAVASGSPDISGLNALKTACRTASYSAMARRRLHRRPEPGGEAARLDDRHIYAEAGDFACGARRGTVAGRWMAM